MKYLMLLRLVGGTSEATSYFSASPLGTSFEMVLTHELEIVKLFTLQVISTK